MSVERGLDAHASARAPGGGEGAGGSPRTLIVSDLHLGSLPRTDLLRREDLRAALLRALSGGERVVLLGDTLELRHGPMREALAAARTFFESLGEALGSRGEILLVAGNHDHALVEPWLAQRGQDGEPAPLALEQLLEPAQASPALARIARWAAPARVRAAYPGVWLRDDVYAMHGHYLDCHLTVPTLERLSVGAMCRVLGRSADTFASVDDYETTVAPVFAWRDAVAREVRTGAALNGMATVVAWDALSGRDGARRARGRGALARRLRRRALAAGFPLAVAALNRAGIGPLRAELSLRELGRAGLVAIGEVATRLRLRDAYVIFGHTHRAGPLPGDDERDWRAPCGARLVNSGSWTYASIFLTDTPGESPYWPGTCVLLDGDAPPRILRLLDDRTRAQLAPARTPSASPG
ncbi:MAG TPA: metallophosphoesterase [Solirubrobacteraceae bacterium]|nr:metallophosphoesterase [Solirubrobacteraceae bacterium]